LLGADISMQLDECTNFPCERDEAGKLHGAVRALGRALQSRFWRTRSDQALFGIVQGSVFEDLRRESAEALVEKAMTATRSAASRWARGLR
jgi:queuine tRNA-ribosyltransferase